MWKTAFLTAAATMMALAGCGDKTNGVFHRPTTSHDSRKIGVARGPFKLVQVRSCKSVRSRLADHVYDQYVVGLMNSYRYRRRYRYHRRSPMGGRRMPMPRRSVTREAPQPSTTSKSAPRSPSATSPADGTTAGGSGPGYYTKTNNQVVGVDEADRVKTDGKYIYTIHGRQVVIVKSWPAKSTRVVSRYEVGKRSAPHQLFIQGDRLVVFSRSTLRRDLASRPLTHRFGSRRRPMPRHRTRRVTKVTVLDIKDRAKPKLVANIDVEGTMLRARMIGRNVYLVSNYRFTIPLSIRTVLGKYNRFRYGGMTTAALAQLRSDIRRAVTTLPLAQLMPLIRFEHQRGVHTTRPLLGCSDLYLPTLGIGSNLLTLTRINTHGGPVHATGIMASGMKVYASKKSLFAAATATNPRNPRQSGTAIHKFDLGSGKRAPSFAASGWVPGTLLNQFSMDEHKGHLRVAVTERGYAGKLPWHRWSRWRGRSWTTSSAVFVLRQKGEGLCTVGSVRGLAPNERIYAARMMGDKGYLVTFRRTDPLYTLDLSTPTEPRVRGELKIPGFSSYIHPLGKDKLLTVGQNADESGRVKGAHLQIFDVSDLSKPRRTAHYELTTGRGTSRSTAQFDHHAFTYNARKNILALPLTVYRYHANGGHFNGLVLVKVNPNAGRSSHESVGSGPGRGFHEIGAIDHSDLAQRAACARSPHQCNRPRSGYWNVAINRSLFIDEHLYTLSNQGLKVNRLGRLNQVAALTLAVPTRAMVRPQHYR
jgi:uncharacterized secreted protein with C-terminal beta-propeller domain